MKILVFGNNGQVGWELGRSLQSLGELSSLGRERADFSRPDELANIVLEMRPDVVVNAVAYTAVDKAEDEPALAATVNARAPAAIAGACAQTGALLVHYSTDYVYDGSKHGVYLEDDVTGPLNVYGQTKLEGEQAIADSGCDYIIFRTSWVYSGRGANFLLTILRLAAEREQLGIVDDQVGCPTWARSIAEMTAQVIPAAMQKRADKTFRSNIYHLVSAGSTSWCGFAREIVDVSRQLNQDTGIIVRQINPITSEEFKTRAKRPLNSVLSTEKLRAEYGVAIGDWKSELYNCVSSMNQD